MRMARENSPATINRWLGRMFRVWVLALALYQFGENTADPDLWAHTLFGEQNLLTGKIQKTEVYSWTAQGLPFINHEVLAETIIGGSHLLAGGTGILLLKIIVGFLTFGLALGLGGASLKWPQKAVAWAVGAIAVVEISYGFPPRPQIFTALALALEFWLLRKIHQEKFWWALALPILFVFWINAHGGAVAGLGLMFVTAGASTAQFFWNQLSRSRPLPLKTPPVSAKTLLVLWGVSAACAVALLANPWGYALVRWIVVAVLWPRPEIEEWNPPGVGWNHAAFFFLILLAFFAFSLSRRPRAFWEMAVCVVLALQAVRTVRHTPLFAIAALAFVPPHLADALERCRGHVARLEELFSRPNARAFLGFVFAVLSILILAAFPFRKEHPLTMEAPRGQYPIAAVDFMRRHGLRGNVLTFFDWGEMCLWELPDCAVSMDGRMDACYPHDLITEHWAFYNNQPVNPRILDVTQADLALLPANLAGAGALAKLPGWQAVYFDGLAVVLARNVQRFPDLPPGHLPVEGDAGATIGRAAFPDALPPRLAKLKH